MQKFSKKLEEEKKSLDQVISKFISIRKVDESELGEDHFGNEPLSGQNIHFNKHLSGTVLSPDKNFGFNFNDISAIEGDLQGKGHSGLRNRAESFPKQLEGSPNEFGKVPEQRSSPIDTVDEDWQQAMGQGALNDTALDFFYGLEHQEEPGSG